MFRGTAGHTVRTQNGVTASAGQRRGDVEIRSYLQVAAGRRSLVFDLSMCVCLLLQDTKLFAWGGGDIGGHVLRETTSRGLCGLVCPSRTSERGGEGDCVKEGGGRWGGEGKCDRERALERLRCYSP